MLHRHVSCQLTFALPWVHKPAILLFRRFRSFQLLKLFWLLGTPYNSSQLPCESAILSPEPEVLVLVLLLLSVELLVDLPLAHARVALLLLRSQTTLGFQSQVLVGLSLDTNTNYWWFAWQRVSSIAVALVEQ